MATPRTSSFVSSRLPRAASRVGLAALMLAVVGGGTSPPVTGQSPIVDPIAGRGQIRGEVTGPSGDTLVGISIVLSPLGHPHVLYATSTDDRGNYALNHLLTDTYQVRAEGQGFAPLVKDGIQVRPPFRSIIDLEMQPGAPGPTEPVEAAPGENTGRVGRVEGRFLDVEGNPVLEGSIVFRRTGHAADIFYGRTDPRGRFVLSDLPPGLYEITSRSPGLIPLHLGRRHLPPTQTFYLRLVAPSYPLSFRGWLDDLLPLEVPLPPPLPRQVELEDAAPPDETSPPEDEEAGNPEEDPPSEGEDEAP